MKIHSILISCFFITISSTYAQDKASKFHDEKGNFKILFPKSPEITKKTGDTDSGKITITSFNTEYKNGDNLSYNVSYIDYPKSFTDTLSVKNIYGLFNGAQTTNINSESIQLLGTFNLDILGHVGREFRWKDIDNKIMFRARFYLVDNRMYILSVRTQEKNNFNVGINQFLESFELIGVKPKVINQKEVIKSQKIYKIKFPMKAEKREMETSTEYGKSNIYIELYQPKLKNDDNLIYMISVMEYPKDITKTSGFKLDEYYSNVIKKALLGRQSKLISEKKVFIAGNEGIEVKESFKGGLIVIKQKTFIKQNLQISLQVMTIPSNDENDSMNNFFKSFKLLL